jgi:hypothetical protein
LAEVEEALAAAQGLLEAEGAFLHCEILARPHGTTLGLVFDGLETSCF